MSKRIFRAIEALWLFAVFVTAGRRLYHYYIESLGQVNSDAQYTYLPAARHILENAWEFLSRNPQSYTVAPLGYLWPALWGADETLIRAANSALFLCCIWLVWKTATRMGGLIAGMVATFILVRHPAIGYYIPKVLTESIFLFGLLLMIWAATEIITAHKRSTRYFAIAGTGLAITLLSRPVLQLMVLASIAACIFLIMAWRMGWCKAPGQNGRDFVHKAFITLLMAATLPLLVVIKNGLAFDVWSISTGSGAGLYYGVNPLRQGIEPSFLGFEYDMGKMVGVADPSTGGEPLSQAGDRIARQVALSVVANTSAADNIQFFAQKAFAWVFYSTPELQFDTVLRKYRLFEVLLVLTALVVLLVSFARQGAAGAVSLFNDIKTAFLPRDSDCQPQGMAIAYGVCWLMALGMLAQLIPILYNSRYNGFLLEPWLIFLTATSAAILCHKLRLLRRTDTSAYRHLRWRISGAWYLVIWALVIFAFVKIHSYSKRHEEIELDAYRTGPMQVVLDGNSIGQVFARGNDMRLDEQGFWTIQPQGAVLSIPFSYQTPEPNFMDGLWRISLQIEATKESRCREAYVELIQKGDIQGRKPIRLKANGQMHTYALSGNHQMRPVANGSLRLVFHCPAGTRIRVGGFDLLKSTMPEAARDLIQNGVGINPYFKQAPFLPEN